VRRGSPGSCARCGCPYREYRRRSERPGHGRDGGYARSYCRRRATAVCNHFVSCGCNDWAEETTKLSDELRWLSWLALIVVAAVTAIYLVVQWSPDAIYEIDAILIGLIAGALLSLILFKLALGRFWPWG
jgi:hypothetical protein